MLTGCSFAKFSLSSAFAVSRVTCFSCMLVSETASQHSDNCRFICFLRREIRWIFSGVVQMPSSWLVHDQAGDEERKWVRVGNVFNSRGKWFWTIWSVEIVKSRILFFTLFNVSATVGIGMRWFQEFGIWLVLVPLGCWVFIYFASDFQPLVCSSLKPLLLSNKFSLPSPVVHSRVINVVYCFNSMGSFSYCKLNFQWKSGTEVVRFMDMVWKASLSLSQKLHYLVFSPHRWWEPSLSL